VLSNIKRWIWKRLISRAKFKKWLTLEDIRSKIKKSAEEGKSIEVAEQLCSYLSSAICKLDWENLPWEAILEDYSFATSLHSPTQDHKIFSSKPTKDTFNINDSSWYSWSHTLATKYGWSLEYIADLDIDGAISLIQEILYAEQLEREWQWALSEKSVSYDPSTKKSKFKPLDRPDWLNVPKKVEEPKIVQIRSDMLPSGVIMRWDDANVKH